MPHSQCNTDASVRHRSHDLGIDSSTCVERAAVTRAQHEHSEVVNQERRTVSPAKKKAAKKAAPKKAAKKAGKKAGKKAAPKKAAKRMAKKMK